MSGAHAGRSQAAGLIAALLVGACVSDSRDRPGTVGPGGGGGLGGGGDGDGDADADAGAVVDGGGIVTHDLRGWVQDVSDLGLMPADFPAVAGREVFGLDGSGDPISATSGPDGAVLLAGIDVDDRTLFSLPGDPSSAVLVEATRIREARLPVMDRNVLELVALSVELTVDDLSGHAFVWIEDERGFARPGVAATVDGVSPVRGPFYGTSDPVLLSEVGPTVDTGLIVLLDGLPDTYSLAVFLAEDPVNSVTIPIELEAGVVTFYEAAVRF